MRKLPDPRNHRNPGKFRISLVHHDNGALRHAQELFDRSRLNQRAGGIVGIRQEENTWLSSQRGQEFSEWQLHLRVVVQGFDARPRNFRIVAVHWERWLTDEDVALGIDKSIKENAEGIVAAVCQKQFLGVYPEVLRQLSRGLGIFRISRDFLFREPLDRLPRDGAATNGVLVKIEANFTDTSLRGCFVGAPLQNCLANGKPHPHRRTATALACASNPSGYTSNCRSPAGRRWPSRSVV